MNRSATADTLVGEVMLYATIVFASNHPAPEPDVAAGLYTPFAEKLPESELNEKIPDDADDVKGLLSSLFLQPVQTRPMLRAMVATPRIVHLIAFPFALLEGPTNLNGFARMIQELCTMRRCALIREEVFDAEIVAPRRALPTDRCVHDLGRDALRE